MLLNLEKQIKNKMIVKSQANIWLLKSMHSGVLQNHLTI